MAGHYNSKMRRFWGLTAGMGLIWGLAGADGTPPPALTPGGIVNAASQLPSSLRGGAIAVGARFTIPGVRLGPDAAVRGSESDPPAKLADVAVRVVQGDRAWDAGLLSVSATRIDALMPSSAHPGEAQVTVTYKGQTSEPYGLTLVAESVGFFPPDATPSAAAGETVTLKGTGAGTALEVMVGGQPADNVHVAGGECCKGVEEISFRVPAGAPAGCFVPVQARTGDGRPSNAIAIAVHTPGAPCHDELDWFRESVEKAHNAGFLALARVSIDLHLPRKSGSQYQFDYGIASFGRQESGHRQFPPMPPAGTCTVFTARLNLRQILGQARAADFTSMPEKTRGNRRLDVGDAISITGPAGTRTLPPDRQQKDYYSATLGGVVPFARGEAKPLYLNRGAYTVTAPGGADVGPFSTKLEVAPVILWKNRDRIDVVDRDAGVSLEWKAVKPNDAVLLLAVNADRNTGDSAVCLCMAHAADGQFRIPPIALGNLPETNEEDDLSASFLGVMELPVAAPSRIEAHGLDSAFAAFVSASARLVRYR
jgi:uncharacterized protein (TIGR03437 family)